MFVSFDASVFEGLMASPFEKITGYKFQVSITSSIVNLRSLIVNRNSYNYFYLNFPVDGPSY